MGWLLINDYYILGLWITLFTGLFHTLYISECDYHFHLKIHLRLVSDIISINVTHRNFHRKLYICYLFLEIFIKLAKQSVTHFVCPRDVSYKCTITAIFWPHQKVDSKLTVTWSRTTTQFFKPHTSPPSRKRFRPLKFWSSKFNI